MSGIITSLQKSPSLTKSEIEFHFFSSSSSLTTALYIKSSSLEIFSEVFISYSQLRPTAFFLAIVSASLPVNLLIAGKMSLFAISSIVRASIWIIFEYVSSLTSCLDSSSARLYTLCFSKSLTFFSSSR